MVAYIFGAGASAGENSSYPNFIRHTSKTKSVIPTVYQVKERLEYLVNSFSNLIDVTNITGSASLIDYRKQLVLGVHSDLIWLRTQLSTEPFIDILAETIFSTLPVNYFDKLVSAWSTYLIIEQYLNGVDQRYKTFFTTWFTKPMFDSASNNLLIFNWNQDLQIEEAIVEKRKINNNETYNKIINGSTILRNELSSTNQESKSGFKHFKLNGTAGNIKRGDTTNSFAYEIIKASNPIITRQLIDATLDEKVIQSEIHRIRTANFSNALADYAAFLDFPNARSCVNFSWDKTRDILINQIKEIKRPNEGVILVCVGYSFPPLNALIDYTIFQQIKPSKVYVQCLESEKDILKSKVRELMGTGDEPIMITHNQPEDIKEFYIPYEGLIG